METHSLTVSVVSSGEGVVGRRPRVYVLAAGPVQGARVRQRRWRAVGRRQHRCFVGDWERLVLACGRGVSIRHHSFHSRFVLTFLPSLCIEKVLLSWLKSMLSFCQKCTISDRQSPKIAKINVGQYVCCSCLGSRLALKLLDLLRFSQNLYSKPE